MQAQPAERIRCYLTDGGVRRAALESRHVGPETGDGAPGRTGLETLDEGLGELEPELESLPRIDLPPLGRRRQLEDAVRYPKVGGLATRHVQPAGDDDGVEKGQAQHRGQCADAILGIDPQQDRMQTEQLAGGVQIDQLVDQRVRRPWRREPPAHGLAHLPAARNRLGQPHVTERRIGPPQLGPPDLFVALRAAVLTGNGAQPFVGAEGNVRQRAESRRHGRLLAPGGFGSTCRAIALERRRHRLPDQRLEDDGAPATWAHAGVERLDGAADRRAREGSVGYGRRGRIDLAQVRRPQHDVGEEPGQRPRLEVGGAALLGDGGARHPAAATVQVEDYLTGLGPGLDRGHELGSRGSRGEPLESGQGWNAGELGLGFCGGTPDHAAIVTDAPAGE